MGSPLTGFFGIICGIGQPRSMEVKAMAKKHGTVKDGVIQKRANGTGSLYQKDGKGNWLMRFSVATPNGKRVRKVFSTGTDDLQEARTILNKKAAELGFSSSNREENLVSGLLAAKQNLDNKQAVEAQKKAEAEKQRLADELAAQQKAEAEDRENKAITIASGFVYYCDSKRRPDSGKRTLDGYETQYNLFASWMRENHPRTTKLKDVTPDMAEEFIDHLEKCRSRNTRNKYLIFLRTFWRVLRWNPDAQLTIDPWEGIRTLKQSKDEVIHEPFTVEELIRIGQVINSNQPVPLIRKKETPNGAGNIKDVLSFNGIDLRDEMRVLFCIALYTALRLEDAATLSWSSVDIFNGTITAMPAKTQQYQRKVIIPIHSVLASNLLKVPESRRRGFVLPTIAAMYKNNPSSVTNRTQGIIKAAGIETDAEAPMNGVKARTLKGFHSIRHAASSFFLNAAVPAVIVDRLLTHHKDSMTMRYFHENRAVLQDAISKLPEITQLAWQDHSNVIDIQPEAVLTKEN